jgi:hypothetical protein
MKSANCLAIVGLCLITTLTVTSCYHRDDYNSYPNNNNSNGNTGTRGNINPGYPAEFDEEFNGTDHYAWSFTDAADSAYASISNGSYQYVDYSAVLSNFLTVNTGINTQINFSVIARIKSNKIMGLVFGASTSDNGYAFYIDTAGNYSLYKEGTGSTASTVVIPSTQDTAHAVKNNWNTLEIDQANNQWTGSINGNQVFQITAPAVTGSAFGFKVLPGTIGYADYLVVKNY